MARSVEPEITVAYGGRAVCTGTIPAAFAGRVDIVVHQQPPSFAYPDSDGLLVSCEVRLQSS